MQIAIEVGIYSSQLASLVPQEEEDGEVKSELIRPAVVTLDNRLFFDHFLSSFDDSIGGGAVFVALRFFGGRLSNNGTRPRYSYSPPHFV